MNQNELKCESKPKAQFLSFDMDYRLSVLIAEDDDEMRKLLAEAFCAEGYDVTECRTGVEFLLKLEPLVLKDRPLNYDIIVSDIRMPGVTGLEILEDLHERDELPPVILITAFGNSETHAQAKRFGAAAIFDKPFEMDTLLTKAREIMPFSRL